MPQSVRELEPYPRRRDWTLLVVLALVAASVLFHLMAFQGLSAWARLNAVPPALNQPIEMVMIEVEPPPPPPPPPPAEEPKPDPPKPPPVKVARVEKPVPVEKAPPPPPNEPPPAELPKPAPPLVIGISMSSTTTAGGFAAPVGNTSYGKIPQKTEDPSVAQAYRAPKYVPVYQVDREPQVANEVKIPYPDEAKKAGIEGEVVLSIRIDAAGDVVSVQVLSGPGYGLNEAAAAAIRRFKWTPATKNGEPVETELKYRYTFLLN
jgi:periplasmic protein TonB